ncbi:MAG: patatin-like phospholipase family protein [Anaerolineae bacterium]|nr:patatin-like phospholipase family protein [Anaerolineae bacterium]
MPMNPPRPVLALAIDGGGIRGLMIAQALIALEQELGGSPLIDHPAVKVLAGTSTGALITAGIAVGMTASEIAAMYLEAAHVVFPPLFPVWIPANVQSVLKLVLGMFRPSLHSSDNLKMLVRQKIGEKTGNPDLTLGELRERLRKDQALVITAVDLTQRRTRFLKSYQPHDADWRLWEAVLASSSAPTYLPVLVRQNAYYADGGVGSFGNPAYIAARETIEWQGYHPQDITLFSFGTGWSSADNFEKGYGKPSGWRILDWARHVIWVILDDAIRAQSLDIITDFIRSQPDASALDFRRFQVALPDVIEMDDVREATLARLRQLGDELGRRILDNQHALSDDRFDPEGLRSALQHYIASVKTARSIRETN